MTVIKCMHMYFHVVVMSVLIALWWWYHHCCYSCHYCYSLLSVITVICTCLSTCLSSSGCMSLSESSTNFFIVPWYYCSRFGCCALCIFCCHFNGLELAAWLSPWSNTELWHLVINTEDTFLYIVPGHAAHLRHCINDAYKMLLCSCDSELQVLLNWQQKMTFQWRQLWQVSELSVLFDIAEWISYNCYDEKSVCS